MIDNDCIKYKFLVVGVTWFQGGSKLVCPFQQCCASDPDTVSPCMILQPAPVQMVGPGLPVFKWLLVRIYPP